MKYLIKSVHTWVVPTVEDVERLHQELLDDSMKIVAASKKTKDDKVVAVITYK